MFQKLLKEQNTIKNKRLKIDINSEDDSLYILFMIKKIDAIKEYYENNSDMPKKFLEFCSD